MKTKHTPGPWRIVPHDSLPNEFTIREAFRREPYGYSDRTICCVTGEDNARLLAAAPELVEALRELVEVVDRELLGDPGSVMDHQAEMEQANHVEHCAVCKAQALLARIDS